LAARYTRVAMTQRYKRLIDEGLGYGLALEGLASLENKRLQALAAETKES
jgi:hypothetical protein